MLSVVTLFVLSFAAYDALGQSKPLSVKKAIASPKKATDIQIENAQDLERFLQNASKFTAMRSLRIRGRSIDGFPYDVCNLTQLKELYLEIPITELPSSISQLHQLEVLQISPSGPYSANDEYSEYDSYESFDEEGNDLTVRLLNLTPAIGQLKQLRRLELVGAGLTTLPSEVGSCASLEELVLDQSNVEWLPYELGNLRNLKMLSIRNGKLQQLNTGLWNCSNLRTLHASCRGDVLPGGISQLRQLDTLILDMPMKRVPEELFECRSLVKLSLISLLRGVVIPNQFHNLTALQELSLSGEYVSEENAQRQEIPSSIGMLQNLKVLELWYLGVTDLKTSLNGLRQLKKLSLSGNRITSIAGAFRGLDNLEELDLSSSAFQAISGELAELRNLKMLNLTYSRVQYIQDGFASLQNLQSLNLSSTQISYFPDALTKLPKLNEVDFSGSMLGDISDRAVNQLSHRMSINVQSTPFADLLISGERSRFLKACAKKKIAITYFPEEEGC